MRDRLTKERRSWNMSRIRGKNTSPEIVVRKLLHRMGYRFRLHVRIPITLSASTGERVKGEVSKFFSGVRRSTKFPIPLPLRAGERARGEVLLVPHSALRVPRSFVCPDIVLPKYKTVIFVHGCFWHRHRGCMMED